jgi:hypothetical protein
MGMAGAVVPAVAGQMAVPPEDAAAKLKKRKSLLDQ